MPNDPDWADGLPHDVIVAIFDRVPTRAGIRGAAMTCRSWNRASYHAASAAAAPVPHLCSRYLAKTLWRVRDLTCVIGSSSTTMVELCAALGNLRWLETLDVTSSEIGADASPIVDDLPASLKTLRIRGVAWHFGTRSPSGVEDLLLQGCDDLVSFDPSSPSSLSSLTVIECAGHVEVPRGVRRLTMQDAGLVSYEYPKDDPDPHAIFFGDDRVRDTFFAWNVVFDMVEDEFDEFAEGYVFPSSVRRIAMATRSLYVAHHVSGTNSFVVDPHVTYTIDILSSDDFVIYNEQLPNL